MSNSLAIAAATMTLRQLCIQAFADENIAVTSLPPDRAATATGDPRLNIYLYQTTLNGAYRNMDLPAPGSGLTNPPPLLPLNLHYLLTAYSVDDVSERDHQILGRAMRALHDQSILSPEFIQSSTSSSLSDADLHRQPERVRITQEPLTIEEISKLWASFQTQYRISAVYQVSPILIESGRPRRTVLPVLSRGENDIGPEVAAGTPPRLSGVEFRNVTVREPALPAAQVGTDITVYGAGLSGLREVVAAANIPGQRRAASDAESDSVVELARLVPQSLGRNDAVLLRLTDSPAWVCGALSLYVEYLTPTQKLRRTNPIRLPVAPEPVTSPAGVSALPIVEAGRRKLLVNLRHPARSLASTSLVLIGLQRSPSPPPLPAEVNSVQGSAASPVFDIHDVKPGRYRLQVRVDDVDSPLMVRDGSSFRFDELLEVDL